MKTILEKCERAVAAVLVLGWLVVAGGLVGGAYFLISGAFTGDSTHMLLGCAISLPAILGTGVLAFFSELLLRRH